MNSGTDHGSMKHGRRSSPRGLVRLSEQLQAACKGPFLKDEEAYWAQAPPRRHLQDRRTRIARQLGDLLEREECRLEADQLYEHALRLDPSAEWACQGVKRYTPAAPRSFIVRLVYQY